MIPFWKLEKSHRKEIMKQKTNLENSIYKQKIRIDNLQEELSKTISYKNADTLANSNIALGIGPHIGNEEMSFVGENLISVLEEVL